MVVGILFIMRQSTLDATPWSLMPALILTGLGMGFTFAPMTAATMRDVPLRISGSASGILNTMRNIGQVLGIAVLGSVLQHQVGVHVDDRLESTGTPSDTRESVVEYAQQSQFERIAVLVPSDQLAAVMNAVQGGFTESIQNTFFWGAFICLLSAGAAYFLRDPVRKPAATFPPAINPAKAPAD